MTDAVDASHRRSTSYPHTIFGVHAGLQNTTPDDLKKSWALTEALGFDWISIFDHLYSANGTGGTHCLESVTIHALLAASTRYVRCGSLVYVPSYRHPAILAKAMATLDHISDGRITLGLGAGWNRKEYASFGIDYLDNRDRLQQLREAVECLDALLNGDGPVSYAGKWFNLNNAVCDPAPRQGRMPIWVGGGGEQLTLGIAARTDGWNVPLVSPEVFAHKKSVLAGHCDRLGRDVAGITCSVNVGVALDEADLRMQFGRNAETAAPGVLIGSPEQMRERIGAYVASGADQINFAVRPYGDPARQLDKLHLIADMLRLVPREGR